MSSPSQRSILFAKWSFIGVLGLTAYLSWDFVYMERDGSGTGIFFVAGVACVTAYFRYRKLKRQRGLILIGDEKPLNM
jgi:hypothetical protein